MRIRNIIDPEDIKVGDKIGVYKPGKYAYEIEATAIMIMIWKTDPDYRNTEFELLHEEVFR